MRIRDSVAFVTGANRGLGLAFVHELLAAGAKKVYAATRFPEQMAENPRVDRVRLNESSLQLLEIHKIQGMT